MKKQLNLYIISFLCFITLVGVIVAYFNSTSILENEFNARTQVDADKFNASNDKPSCLTFVVKES